MKILIVCDVLGEENNGTTIASMNLIRFLKSRGHEVRILCADQEKAGEDGVYVVPNLNFGRLLNAYVAKVGITLAKADEAIVREALDGVDLVHTMLPFSLGMKVAKIAHEMNIPLTAGMHMHAKNLTSYIKLNRLGFLDGLVYKFVYDHVYKYCDAIHFPTEFMRSVFEKSIKKTTKGYVISNGVHSYVKPRPSEKPEELRERIVILSTGRYAREKSQDTLIKAVALSKYSDKIQLILGGKGVKEKYYKKLGERLPIEPIYHFFERDEIIDVLNYSDIYVHPAEVELEGISCLEAIVCGKLTIVSDSKESATRGFALDEKCIFKSRSPRSLAAVIDYWIEHPEEKLEYEKRYRECAVAYSQEECMLRMEKMMEETIVEKRKACLLL